MLIAFHGIDRPGTSDLRAATRPSHLEFHATRRNLVAGPLRDEAGDVCGTMIVFEADDVATGAAEMAADPYAIAGLFERTSTTEFVALLWPTGPPG